MSSWDNPTYDIHKGLLYSGDDRRDPEPDDEALEVFKRGWQSGMYDDDEDFGERAFQTLSWKNLGYRFGLLFGKTSEELQEELYYWCVEQMRQ
jgi:hypothetical protein